MNHGSLIHVKNQLLTVLRDKTTPISIYRRKAEQLANLLVFETADLLELSAKKVQTPITTAKGVAIADSVVLVSILRSGLSLLHAFENYFEEARVGILGFERNKESFEAKLYYQNIPEITPKANVIIMDPILATGGTASHAAELLKTKGAEENRMIFTGVIGSAEGMDRLKKDHPKMRIVLGAIDDGLNKDKFITPGIGDFGDRYYGSL